MFLILPLAFLVSNNAGLQGQLFDKCMENEGKKCGYYLSAGNCENICRCMADKLTNASPIEEDYLRAAIRRAEEDCYQKITGRHPDEFKY